MCLCITDYCTGSQQLVTAVWEVLALGSHFCQCWLCWWPTSTSSSSLNPQAPSLPQTSQNHLFLQPNSGSGAKHATSDTSATAKCRPDLFRLRAILNGTIRNLCLRMFNPTVISFSSPVLCFPEYFYIMTRWVEIARYPVKEMRGG